MIDFLYRDRNEHDIALLQLATPLDFSTNVRAIKLPSQETVPTGDGILSGWGSISKQWWPKYPAILQTATIPIITKEECYTALHEFPKNPNIFATQLCTGPIHTTVSACAVSIFQIFAFFLANKLICEDNFIF